MNHDRGFSIVPLIPLARMPQQEEVRSAEDDWTGSTNAAERRKRQNRMHQRIFRKRQKLRKLEETAPQVMSHNVQLDGPEDDATLRNIEINTTHGIAGVVLEAIEFLDPHLRQRLSTSGLTPVQIQVLIQRVEIALSEEYNSGSPRTDLLLTLVQFNVFRALVHNTYSLGFDFAWLTGDAISIFNHSSRERYCPPSLKPTEFQHQVSHHPWIDLFPFPALRDNLLCQGEEYDDEDLCHDMVEVCHAPSERSGLIVWSEPWDPSSWEVTEEFAAKWPWMLRNCVELLHSTNQWRRQRGDDDLVFDVSPLDSAFI